jgi:amidase
VFGPKVTDARILAHFETTVAELRAAGAEVVDPFFVEGFEKIPRPPQTPSRFKADLTAWIAAHPGVPYPSVSAIAESKLLHPLHQAGFEDAVKARLPEEDPATLEGAKNEEKYRELFTAAMDAQKIDALVFPTWAQLPALNGDRNTQLTADPKPAPNAGPTALGSSLTFVGSSLQWPALSVPSGYIEGLPVGLQILGRAWDEANIVNYAFAYEQATQHRRPPGATPPLPETFAAKFIGVWKLIGITDKDAATGQQSPSARGPASGQLVYDPSGRLSVQIMSLDRSKAPAGSSEGFSSYFGRWELNVADGYMLHIQEGNVNAAQVGQRAKRFYHFDPAGRLGLETPVRKRDDGKESSTVFWWEKL